MCIHIICEHVQSLYFDYDKFVIGGIGIKGNSMQAENQKIGRELVL